MDYKTIELLKQDLAKAVREKNYVRIEELRQLLNISDEQAKYFEKGLTGYPSIDKVWEKYYEDGDFERANDVPSDKTLWDVYEEKLEKYDDYPVLEYFKRKISSPEFINSCYVWARTFRAMGVEPGEVVPVYGPFVPEVGAMLFGLNMIGACPYFLKLKISPEALEEETRKAKIAVVFNDMWGNVAHEFSKDKFKNVVVYTVTDDMPNPTKQIVSFLGKMKLIKNKSAVPNEKKYIWYDKAMDIACYYSGPVKVPFESNRNAIITSSSGSTIGGVVKGTVATNESVLGQIWSGYYTKTPFYPRDRVLNNFPPTASTSLNSLFLLGLFFGSTIVMDPRVSDEDFYRQLTILKPNIALSTGSFWKVFFNRVKKEMKQGKKFDFSYAKGWTIGGEGIDVKDFLMWEEIMAMANAYNGLFSGFGLSEDFSAVSVDNVNATRDYSRPMVGVGVPQIGMVISIFDKDGNELTYNQRGEVRVKSKATMKEYYGKPELTAKTKVEDWILTGDLGDMDENGFLYIWGRMTNSIKTDKSEIYLFDIANKIKEESYIDDALVLAIPTDDNPNNLVAHIVWSEDVLNEDKTPYIIKLNEVMSEYLPSEITLETYAEHDEMIPYSPTTLKKDGNRLAAQSRGFMQVKDGKLESVEYCLLSDGSRYSKVAREPKQKRLIKIGKKNG